MEIWKPIRNHESLYAVSDLGNVRSQLTGLIKKLSIARTGYQVCTIAGKTCYVHRLVADAFIREMETIDTVNHMDGVKTNNRLSNLEILSYQDNHLHAFKVLNRKPSALGKFGKDHNRSKPVVQFSLTGVKLADFENARQASAETGIGHKQISACCIGKRKSTGGFCWSFK